MKTTAPAASDPPRAAQPAPRGAASRRREQVGPGRARRRALPPQEPRTRPPGVRPCRRGGQGHHHRGPSPARRWLLPRDLPSAPGKAMLGQGRAGQGLATCAPAGWKDSVGSRRRRRRREELLPPDAAAAPLCRIHPPAGCPGTAVPRRPFPGPLWPPRPPGGGARSPRPRPRQAGQLPPGRQHRGPGRLRSRWGRGQTEGGR